MSLFFTSFSYATFPQFEYSQTSFPNGPVDIYGSGSSGTQINLYLNNEYIGAKDIIANGQVYSLINNIEDIEISLGSSLTFKNDNPSKTYRINIPGKALKTLNFGDTLVFTSYEVGSITYTDEISGISKNINVVDTLSDFNFENIESNLIDGDNIIKFVQKYPLSTLDNENEFTFNINYLKYSNTIIVTEYVNVTNDREITIKGYNSNSNSNLYYILNYNKTISNLGALTPIDLDGNNFNLTLNNLEEGTNIIRFLSIDPTYPNIFNGESQITIISDKTPPTIDFFPFFKSSSDSLVWTKDDDGFFTNSNRIYFNITTDAINITRQLNGENKTFDVENGTLELEIPLVGDAVKNNLTLIATDLAGNIYKEAHEMYFDNKKPTLEDSDPKNGDTVHFFYQNLNGKTKPHVTITAFTIPRDAKDSEGYSISCNNYNDQRFFYRNLGQLNPERIDSVEVNLDEYQLSLLSLIAKKETVTSDSNGDFDVTLILHEDNFNSGDLVDSEKEKTDNEKITKVTSQNTVCFAMLDKFGNYNIDSISVTLDNGNTMWRAGEVTTIPNSIYAAEIEQSGDVRSGSGNVEFGMTIKMQYVGGGKVSNVDGIHIRIVDKNRDEFEFSKYGSIDSSRLTYYMNPETNEMTVYVPVKISPMGISALDYPGEIKFSFAADLTYDVENIDIPIDTANPIYFQSTINVEKPLDHTKWLTPEMLENIQSFLNKSLELTTRAEDIMRKVSVVGMLTCTGAKLYHSYELYELELEGLEKDSPEYIQRREDIDKQLYNICDRVYSTQSPQVCATAGADEAGNKWLRENEYKGVDVQLTDESGEKAIGAFRAQVKGNCDLDGDGKNDDGKLVGGETKIFTEETGVFGTRTIESEEYLTDTCLPYEEGKGINFGKIGTSACYSPGYENYDETRCNFFGADDENQNPGVEKPGGVPNMNPAGSIISSIRCGAIIDTYSHLKQYRQIQEGIYQCLEEAKLGGAIDASYCERLLGQAVCDIATNVVLPEAYRSLGSPRTGADGEEQKRSSFFDFLGSMGNNENAFNSRYTGTIYSKAGLSSENIINKACLWAISGDWSVIEDHLLAGIEQNEITPVFGPPFAESRIQGYDPITGDLSIRYFFTYGAISGGQAITSKVELICDTSAPNGEFCPDDGFIVSSSVPGSSFTSKNLRVSAGGSKSESVVISDNEARFWYNKLRITHTYSLDGTQRTESKDFPIAQKKEFIPLDCSFSGGVMGDGAGFNCRGELFGKGALSTSYEFDKENTKIVPTSQSNNFISGNGVYTQVGYYSAGQTTEEVSIVYFPVCNENTNTPYYPLSTGTKSIQLNPSEISNGRFVHKVFDVPAADALKTALNPPRTITAPDGSIVTEPTTNINSVSCNMYMRFMPTIEAGNLNKDNFKTYNSVDAEYTNVLEQEVLKRIFTLKTTSESSVNYFTLVKPFDGLTVCVTPKDDEIKIPLSYVLQNTNSPANAKAQLNYSVTSTRYIFDNSKNNPINIEKGGIGSKEISIKMSESMKSDLKSGSTSNSLIGAVDGHLFGVGQPVSLNLRYTVSSTKVISEEAPSPGRESKISIQGTQSGDINLILISNDNCGNIETIVTPTVEAAEVVVRE